VLLNAYWEPLGFKLPANLGKQRWTRVLDTSRARQDGDEIARPDVQVEARSVVVLRAAPDGRDGRGA
jgi:pullulanase/glycogen debranching enzyme